MIKQASGSVTVIQTNTSAEVSIEPRRLSWRSAGGEWAVWSPEVDASVLLIESHEKIIDQRGLSNKPLIVGAFVLVERASKRIGSFVTKISGKNYICSYAKQHAGLGGVTTCLVMDDMLDWNQEYKCWVARFRRSEGV